VLLEHSGNTGMLRLGLSPQAKVVDLKTRVDAADAERRDEP
jgi:hypothetical protein